MTADQILSRLVEQCPAFQGRIYHRARISEVLEQDFDTPVGHVARLPPLMEGEPDGLGALHSQARRHRFVVVVTATAPVESGDDEALNDAVNQVYDALHGWSPSGGDAEPLRVEDPEPVEGLVGRRMTWALNFSYLDHLRHVR